MDEAEALCDRVLFIQSGRMVITGVPPELITNQRAANLDDLYLALMGGGAS